MVLLLLFCYYLVLLIKGRWVVCLSAFQVGREWRWALWTLGGAHFVHLLSCLELTARGTEQQSSTGPLEMYMSDKSETGGRPIRNNLFEMMG